MSDREVATQGKGEAGPSSPTSPQVVIQHCESDSSTSYCVAVIMISHWRCCRCQPRLREEKVVEFGLHAATRGGWLYENSENGADCGGMLE